MRITTFFPVIVLLFFLTGAGQSAALKVGDIAPDFELIDQEGKLFKLSDLRGQSNVVIAFYVLAFTGGWTAELKGYQSDIDYFKQHDTKIVGVSVDARPTQKRYAEELGVEYTLLSDFHRKVSQLYGVLDEVRGLSKRTTFVIDKQGVIRRIDSGRDAIDITGAKSSCARLQ